MSANKTGTPNQKMVMGYKKRKLVAKHRAWIRKKERENENTNSSSGGE